MKNIFLLFLIIILLGSSSCGKQSIQDIERFDPQFSIGDFEKDQIINRNSEVVSCQEPKFNEYLCMHVDKVKELNKILSRYRRRKPLKVQSEIKEIIRNLEER